jgi:acetylornithine deacetylase/succinyl-diaminopimelate desuccinylase-like protein
MAQPNPAVAATPPPLLTYAPITAPPVITDGDPREIYAGGADLIKMHRFMRPAWSKTEEAFIEEFVKPLGTEADTFGNHWLTISAPDGTPSPIMWSSHTDTVHTEHGTQNLEYGDGFLMAKASSCLGADCSAGVWVMSEMIKARVPGTYVFHRGEEIGGVGSRFISDKTPERLTGLRFAIAWDRKGYEDVITHQFGRTSSDAFALSMAAALRPMAFKPNAGGIFTDTANYASIISECTNMSVGYENAHSPSEKLFVPHLVALRDTVCKADFSGLVEARDPTVVDLYADGGDWWSEPSWRQGTGRSSTKTYSGPTRGLTVHAKIEDIVYDYPEEIALFLEEHGFTADDLNTFLAEYKCL